MLVIVNNVAATDGTGGVFAGVSMLSAICLVSMIYAVYGHTLEKNEGGAGCRFFFLLACRSFMSWRADVMLFTRLIFDDDGYPELML